MSNKDKYVGFRISEDTYEEIRLQAEREEITVSDFVRKSVQHCLSGVKQDEKLQLHIVKQQLSKKDEQIDKKDEQIDHLHQLLAMKEKNTNALTEQLEQKELMLEDLQNRSVWKKLKAALSSVS